MADPLLFRLRVTYGKTGRLALLSHLEITHALERAVRRAGLPFAVTQGFSPHMRIAFGSALPVGVGGVAEIFDIFLARNVNPADVLDALQSASVEELYPTAAKLISPRAPAASVAFPYSTYEAELSVRVTALAVPRTVTVRRKKKEKELIVADFLADGPTCETTGAGYAVRFTLQAKEDGSLRPDVLINACLAESGLDETALMGLTRVAQTARLVH